MFLLLPKCYWGAVFIFQQTLQKCEITVTFYWQFERRKIIQQTFNLKNDTSSPHALCSSTITKGGDLVHQLIVHDTKNK